MRDRELHNQFGEEVPDPTPLEVPVFRREPPLHDLIKAAVRNEVSKLAESQGFESFEEANDFDIDDDDGVPVSKHEFTEMQEEYLSDKIKEVDKEAKEVSNKSAAISQRKKGDTDGPESERASDVRESAGGRREKRSASGGEGRSAGRRGERVSEVQRGSGGHDKEGAGGNGEDE